MNTIAFSNRVRLANLIFSMNSFTKYELINKYTEDGHNCYFGGLKNIDDILNELSQFGTLRFEQGKYTVAGFGENKLY